MKKLIGVFLIGFAVTGISTAWSWERKIDFNGDGFKEARAIYSGNQIVKTLIDANDDGWFETVIHYKGGYRDRAEQDFNRDGVTDRWIYYYFTGGAWKVAEDLNHDGEPDYWLYLKDGKAYKWEQDRNGDGKADVKTTYELEASGKEKVLVQQSFDEDFDGLFEKLSGITVVRKEAMIPHSLAEALLR